ncbi:MAG: DNA polymerase IV [Chloroflexi bacterium]|jgi:DNA polymerase IV|nr:DNA polymerase IV [Chloroflexota bacterium]
MERQIFHIDLDSFFVSAEQVLNHDLLGKPVVVGGHPDSRGVVACASYEARKFGLHAGMPIATAHRLCPQTIFLPGNFSLYRDFSARFMDILADFSPDLEPGGLDEAFLDLTGFEPLYGPTRETARRLKSRIRDELEITASIGIATCKVVAKVASDFSKPDGLVEVAAGQEISFLAPLPIKDLPGVGPKMQEALKRFGVSTIGQLAKLPVSLLKDQFGIHGEMIRRHANGIDDRKVKRYDTVKSISRETTLEQDTLDLHLLKATLKHLTERIGADLRLQERQARCVTLKLRYSDFDTITRSQTQKQPTDLDQVIFNVGSELLDNCLSQRRHPIRLIGIGISNLTGPEKQLNLLDTSSQKLAYLDQAIDQIRKKYGFSAIQTGQTLPIRNHLGHTEKHSR